MGNKLILWFHYRHCNYYKTTFPVTHIYNIDIITFACFMVYLLENNMSVSISLQVTRVKIILNKSSFESFNNGVSNVL